MLILSDFLCGGWLVQRTALNDESCPVGRSSCYWPHWWKKYVYLRFIYLQTSRCILVLNQIVWLHLFPKPTTNLLRSRGSHMWRNRRATYMERQKTHTVITLHLFVSYSSCLYRRATAFDRSSSDRLSFYVHSGTRFSVRASVFTMGDGWIDSRVAALVLGCSRTLRLFSAQQSLFNSVVHLYLVQTDCFVPV